MLQTKRDAIERRSRFPAAERQRLISKHVPLMKFQASRLAAQLSSAANVDHLINASVRGLIEAATRYERGGEQKFEVPRRPPYSSRHDRRLDILGCGSRLAGTRFRGLVPSNEEWVVCAETQTSPHALPPSERLRFHCTFLGTEREGGRHEPVDG